MAQRVTDIMGHWFQRLTGHTSCHASSHSLSSSCKAVKRFGFEKWRSHKQLASIEMLRIIRDVAFCHALLHSGHISFIFFKLLLFTHLSIYNLFLYLLPFIFPFLIFNSCANTLWFLPQTHTGLFVHQLTAGPQRPLDAVLGRGEE